MHDHLVSLAGDWALWRDFAVRSAGFPVRGLDVFGASDESARLADIAADCAFADAVAWQNRSAYRTAVAKIAGRTSEPGSKRRRRDGVVAAYWQRYCSKNDTIGFFGPLAWGAIRDAGPAISVRSRGLIASREVHLESWCMEALAQTVHPSLVVSLNGRPEIDLRRQLDELGHAAGLRALDRLEVARVTVVNAPGGQELLDALDAFDALLEELAGAPRAPGDAGSKSGRTPLYLDCMRDLDVEIGPAIVGELAASLPLLLEASRWWCGRTYAYTRETLAEVLTQGFADGPLAPLYHRGLSALGELPQFLAAEVGELQSRCAALVEDDDDATIAGRAAHVFADHAAAWPFAVYHSADVQIAAHDLDAIDAGEFLAVVGDFHGGNNPLTQGMFSTRFHDFDRFRALFHADVGGPIVIPPRRPGARMSSRLMSDFAYPDDIHVLGAGIPPIHVGDRAVQISDLVVCGDQAVDPAGGFRMPLADLFYRQMFDSALQTFQPFAEVGPRITVGRTVLRRSTWRARASDRPLKASGMAAWAAKLGVPRRAFCLPGGERKPVYVDFSSPALTRNLHRMLARATAADPDAPVRFSEMLPDPTECWLEHAGERFTSELRIVAVDRTRRAS
jgi:hypothetical protein